MKIWKIRRISHCRSRMHLFSPVLCELDWIILCFCFRDKIRNHKHFQCNFEHQDNAYSFRKSWKFMKISKKTQIPRNGLSWSMHPAVWDLLDFWYFHVWAVKHFFVVFNRGCWFLPSFYMIFTGKVHIFTKNFFSSFTQKVHRLGLV